ncbi:survival motor neuron protein [Toxorhynchites rutilus septentrionalis]|uniref:survival motor neuron protein n=1 Tax=Toxorhynchites rutilus septentrionalis TaxID=329112 RepID=UPI00247AF357|nr:survival motor neuron protein [Toxorhynchites rutilus septentrionalis]
MNPLRGTSSSGSECEQSTDDIWDDTLIIRNYDESLALVKEEVAKRLAMKTNKKMLAKVKAEQNSLEQVTPNEESEVKREEAESSGVEGSSAEKGAYESADKTLKVGDYCRATYDDGVDYEAKVLAIDKNNALIRYVGYNNEQTVSLEDLIPSWGRKARRKQREEAAELAAAEDSNRMEISDDEEKLTKKASKIRINLDPNFHMPKPRANSSVAAGFGAGMGASFMVPPPPPMPPMLADDDDLESENLSAMLMSWYMSGYYTGLYHGQKMSQKRSRPS